MPRRFRTTYLTRGLLTWLLVVGLIGSCVYVDPLSCWRPTEGALSASCFENLIQLARGGLMYARDWDERFPPADRWVDTTSPYVRNDNSLRCPAAPRGETVSYGFNARLDTVCLKRVSSPAQTVLFYDAPGSVRNAYGDPKITSFIAWRHTGVLSRPGGWRFRGQSTTGQHNQGANFAWADGHVRSYSRDHYARVLREREIFVRPTREGTEDESSSP